MLRQGHTVVGVDREPGLGTDESLYSEHILNLGTPGIAHSLLAEERPDAVIHCAAIVNFPTLAHDPHYGFQVNVGSAAEFAEASRDNLIARFILLSSRAVYGLQGEQPLTPVAEDDPLQPMEWYDVFKAGAESLCRWVFSQGSTELVMLRFSTIYGPGKDVRHSTANVISRILETKQDGRCLSIDGRGSEPLDLVYVEDAARAVVECATFTGELKGAVFNVGSGTIVTLGRLIETLREVAPGVNVELSEGREALSPRYRLPLSINAIQDAIGFTPEYGLAQGIRHYRNSLPHQT
jgi:UDP-glucose 4-epimerase